MKKFRQIISTLGLLLAFTVSVYAQGFPPNRVTVSNAPTPSSPTLSVGGISGNSGATYSIVCHYSDGSVSSPATFSRCNNAPNTLSSSNYVLLGGWTCPSVDILKGGTNTALAVGVTASTYEDIGNPTIPYAPINSGSPNLFITGPNTFAGMTAYNISSSTISGSVILDTSISSNLIVTLAGNSTVTLANISNSQKFSVDVVENAIGGYNITFNAPTGYTLTWNTSYTPFIVVTPGTHNQFDFSVQGTTIIGRFAGTSSVLQFGSVSQPLSPTAPLPGQFLQWSGTQIVGAAGTGTTLPAGTAGAIQYNSGGSAFGGSVITGLVLANGTSAPTAAAAGTDYQAPITGNTLTAHNFATSINSSGTISGAQPSASDISGLGPLATQSAPCTVAQGCTGASSAGPTGANNIGALARASNLSDLTSPSSARTNLGLGVFAAQTAPCSVAQGCTGATTAGATAANNIGALAEASNLSDLASAATARTNLGLGTSATVNTGTSGATLGLLNGNLTFGGTDTFSSAPTMSGANISSASIPSASLATVQVANGGTGATSSGTTAAHNIGALAPADITTCGDSSHALGGASGAFTCQTIATGSTPLSIVANASSTGTTTNLLATISSTGAVLPSLSQPIDVIGPVVSGAGTTGNASIGQSGVLSCVFDGATTAGNHVVVSGTVRGDCHSNNVNKPANLQDLGIVLSTNASGGTYQYLAYGPSLTPQVYSTLVPSQTLNSGTDVIALTSLQGTYVIGANETLSISQGNAFGSANVPFIMNNIVICQDGTGSRTEAWIPTAAAGITAIYFTGCGTTTSTTCQAGYTLTPSQCDHYWAEFDGTNLYIRQTLSNVPG